MDCGSRTRRPGAMPLPLADPSLWTQAKGHCLRWRISTCGACRRPAGSPLAKPCEDRLREQQTGSAMPRMTGGDAIVDSLLRHGIDTIFGLPGVQMYGLFDAFARNANRLKVINARHEQTTAYMALGYAQSSGKPSAFTVVPGPGVMNTMGALTTAWGVNAPVMCITGQVPSAMIGRGRGQLHEMPDQLATLKTLLKFAERIEHPSDAPQVMARAFQAMVSGRPGPVAVEMPWDMFGATSDVTPVDPLGKRADPSPDPEKIAALAKLVDAAKTPMIWVGGGAVEAGREILALAEKIGAPWCR